MKIKQKYEQKDIQLIESLTLPNPAENKLYTYTQKVIDEVIQ